MLEPDWQIGQCKREAGIVNEAGILSLGCGAEVQPRPQGICCLSAEGFTARRFRVMRFISSRNTNGPENQVGRSRAE